jgi:hypothetical protein
VRLLGSASRGERLTIASHSGCGDTAAITYPPLKRAERRYHAHVQLGETRRTAHVIAGATTTGRSIEIPRGELLELAQERREWRRVVVQWDMQFVEISRGAWEACTPEQPRRNRARDSFSGR